VNLVDSILKAKARGEVAVIAEIKRIIPKLAEEEGRPKDKRDAGELGKMYEKGGAIAISIVTEARYFGGQPEDDVPAVLQSSSLPLLIKDFIHDEKQVNFYVELISRGGEDYLARVTLLLTAHWLGDRLPALLDYVHAKGMLALVETRTPEDLRYLDGFNQPLRLVGINNKDIDNLEKGEDRIKLTPELVSQYRRLVGKCLLVSQSAHRCPEDVRHSIQCGADAVLAGTAFMLSKEPLKTVASFVHALDGKG